MNNMNKPHMSKYCNTFNYILQFITDMSFFFFSFMV